MSLNQRIMPLHRPSSSSSSSAHHHTAHSLQASASATRSDPTTTAAPTGAAACCNILSPSSPSPLIAIPLTSMDESYFSISRNDATIERSMIRRSEEDDNSAIIYSTSPSPQQPTAPSSAAAPSLLAVSSISPPSSSSSSVSSSLPALVPSTTARKRSPTQRQRAAARRIKTAAKQEEEKSKSKAVVVPPSSNKNSVSAPTATNKKGASAVPQQIIITTARALSKNSALVVVSNGKKYIWWIIDSGASAHMVVGTVPLLDPVRDNSVTIQTANNTVLRNVTIGSLGIVLGSTRVGLSRVLSHSGLVHNLMSVPAMCADGLECLFSQGTFTATLNGTVMFTAKMDADGKYMVNTEVYSLDKSLPQLSGNSRNYERTIAAYAGEEKAGEEETSQLAGDIVPSQSAKGWRAMQGAAPSSSSSSSSRHDGGAASSSSSSSSPPARERPASSSPLSPREEDEKEADDRDNEREVVDIPADIANHTSIPVAQLWHNRTCHMSNINMESLIKNKAATGIEGMKVVKHTHHCPGCITARMHRTNFMRRIPERHHAQRVLERIHMDILGPLPQTLVGHRFMLLIVDEYSRFTTCISIARKSKAAENIKAWIEKSERLHHIEGIDSPIVKEVHSDGGGEFIGNELKQYYRDRSIKMTTTQPHTPQQNGIAERMNRTVLEWTRACMHHADAPNGFWSLAMQYATHTRNRVALKADSVQTPYQMFMPNHHPPDLSHIRPFGCDAYVHHSKPYQGDKFAPRAWKGTFIGYGSDLKLGWVVMFADGRITTSRDVEFDEDKFTLINKISLCPVTGVVRDVGQVEAEARLEAVIKMRPFRKEVERRYRPYHLDIEQQGLDSANSQSLREHVEERKRYNLEKKKREEAAAAAAAAAPAASTNPAAASSSSSSSSPPPAPSTNDKFEGGMDPGFDDEEEMNGVDENGEADTDNDEEPSSELPSQAAASSSSSSSAPRSKNPVGRPPRNLVRAQLMARSQANGLNQSLAYRPPASTADEDEARRINEAARIERARESREAEHADILARNSRELARQSATYQEQQRTAEESARAQRAVEDAARSKRAAEEDRRGREKAAQMRMAEDEQVRADEAAAREEEEEEERLTHEQERKNRETIEDRQRQEQSTVNQTRPQARLSGSSLPPAAPVASLFRSAPSAAGRTRAGVLASSSLPAAASSSSSSSSSSSVIPTTRASTRLTAQPTKPVAAKKVTHTAQLATVFDSSFVGHSRRLYDVNMAVSVIADDDYGDNPYASYDEVQQSYLQAPAGELAGEGYWDSEVMMSHRAYLSVIAPTSDPLTWEESQSGPSAKLWKEARDREFESMTAHGVFQVVPLPADRRAIGCKMVFKTKYDADGNVAKLKCRFVAKGFAQREGIDYHETFAPVLHYKTLRILLAMVAALDLELKQGDVPTAFLNADCKEEVYMKIPEGLREQHPPGSVYRLVKTLYGIKQAPRAWNEDLNDTIVALGYTRSMKDSCVYFKTSKTGNNIIIPVFVDDLFPICVTADLKEMERDLASLVKKYKIPSFDDANVVLGMRIRRDRPSRTLVLDQQLYVNQMLVNFGMEQCKAAITPERTKFSVAPKHRSEKARLEYEEKMMRVQLQEEKDDEQDGATGSVKLERYGSVVGAIMYAALSTRPDISHAASMCARHLIAPTKENWVSAMRILRYLKGTAATGLTFGGRNPQDDLHKVGPAYCDADWGGNVGSNRKSTTGYVIKVNGGAVSWASKKQAVVALSTCEAEFMAAGAATQEVMWIRQLCDEIGFAQTTATIIHCDNQPAIAISIDDAHHGRTKHIDIKYYYIKDQVKAKLVTLVYIPSAEQQADILTKALGTQLFGGLRDKIMMGNNAGK